MAELTVQNIALTGLNPSYAAAAAGGDTFDNDGSTFFHIKNGSGGSVTVTLTTAGTYPKQGIALADQQVAVPAGEERMIGPFDKGAFNDSNGEISVSYSSATSVTVAAIKLPEV